MKNLIILLMFIVSGCAMGPRYVPVEPPSEGQVLVHFLQTKAFRGGAYPTVFSVNDLTLVSLHDKGYSYVYLPWGTYVFKTHLALWDSENLDITVPLESGKEYYIEHTHVLASYPRFNSVLREISTEKASAIIHKYRYKEIDQANYIKLIGK